MRVINNFSNYGELLKERREELNLSQSDIGEVLFCSYQAVSRYENGNVQINIAYLGSLCKILEIDLSSFMNLENRKNNDLCDHNSFDKKIFVSGLKILREGKLLTKGDLAKKLGISKDKITRWEEGKSLPSILEFKKIVEFYEVDYEDLYFGKLEKVGELGKLHTKRKYIYAVALSVSTVLIACTIVFGVLGLHDNSNSNWKMEDIDYTINNDNKSIKINKIKVNSKKVFINKKINNYVVTTLGENLFSDPSSLEEVEIDANLIKIESRAFANCPKLEKVYLNNVNESTVSDNRLFENDYKLNYLKTGNLSSVIYMDGFTYNQYGIPYTNSITLEFNEETTKINENFVSVSDSTINKLILPSSLTYVFKNMFNLAENLKYVDLGNGIKELEAESFSHLDMDELVFPASLKEVRGDFGKHVFTLIRSSSKNFFVSAFNAYCKTIDLSSSDCIQIKNYQEIHISEEAILGPTFKHIDVIESTDKYGFIYCDNNINLYFKRTKEVPEYLKNLGEDKWLNSGTNNAEILFN
jgi:transcriptional regulator with XRE-family HTH domain